MGIRRRRCDRIGVLALQLGKHHAPCDGHSASLRPNRASSHSNCGMRPRAGGKFHKRVTAPQQLKPRPRATRFFRKNANKTNEAASPKGFTSIACVPQKSKKLRKNTSGNESTGFVRGAYVDLSGLRKIPESLRTWVRAVGSCASPIAVFSIQILMGFQVISGTRIHHHHKCAHTGVRAAKIPEKSNKGFVSNRLCRGGERSKNRSARSKNTSETIQSPCGETGYDTFHRRSKNAKIACSPKKDFDGSS
jgi:hypothetical protein